MSAYNPKFPTSINALVTQVFNNYNPKRYSGDGRHKGIDYGVMPGNPVYACMDGLVTTAVNVPTGYGRHVRITHPDGSVSIYGHLTIILVKQGQQVFAGQEIGKSGGDRHDGIDGDGDTSGPHLHWEIRPPGATTTDQGAVDPEQYCLAKIPGTYRRAECAASDGLYVRTAPTTTAPALRALRRREQVLVAEIRDGWARLHSLRPEWCSAKYLHMTGEVVTVAGMDDPIEPPAQISDAEKLARLWALHPELHK